MIESIYDLIDKELGISVAPFENPLVTQIETSDTEFLAANQRRIAFVFVNLGSTATYISPNSPATTSKGIQLVANGGFFAANWREDTVLPAYSWRGITTGGASACFCVEMIIQPSPKGRE
tara:strand:+ start:386 stop:745 length:360 start_codon:yes stop_codon:yes gene_type:complete